MHPLLENVEGPVLIRELIRHMQSCEDGCAVEPEAAYCDDTPEEVTDATLDAFAAKVAAYVPAG